MSNKLTKWGLILKKQEMTQLWVNDELVPVTLLKLVPQEVVRHKVVSKDGYNALVVWAEKKELNKDKGIKVRYKYMTEFKVDEDLLNRYQPGQILTLDVIPEDVEKVVLTGISKWKGFQGVVRRFGFSWGPETHGSQFHRHPWGIGNRKPRRVNKWHPLPWHMGLEKVTIKNVKIVDRFKLDNEELLAVKGSVPGWYGWYVKLEIR